MVNGPPGKRPGQGQDLLNLGEIEVRVGRVERAFKAAVDAATRDGDLDAVDSGLAGLAVELARAVDVASRKSDPYGVAAAGRELREVAARLRLDPTARGGMTSDALGDFLRDLADPDPGEVRNSPHP